MTTQTWDGCYEGGWGQLLSPTSYAHPAKMSHGLLTRIIEHGFERGWWRRGDMLVDPFGGIGSTGIIASYHGLRSASVELERKFNHCAVGHDCPGLTKQEWVRWYNRFERNPALCPACQAAAQNWYEERKRGGLLFQQGGVGIIPSHPPHHFQGNFERHRRAWESQGLPLPVMVQGDSRNLVALVGRAAAVVTSPPFVGSLNDNPSSQILAGSGGRMGASCKMAGNENQRNRIYAGHPGENAAKARMVGYGSTPGNIGNMKPGSVDGVVTSPPYENSMESGDGKAHVDFSKCADGRKWKHSLGNQGSRSESYGPLTIGQIGNTTGQTYWEACRDIYAACRQILKPGGILVLVCKDYIKAGKRVPLCDDTMTLLISLGFEPVERIRAMLKKEWVENCFHGEETQETSRKSFFRRLAEAKGSPPIDYEEVLVVRNSQTALWESEP